MDPSLFYCMLQMIGIKNLEKVGPGRSTQLNVSICIHDGVHS